MTRCGRGWLNEGAKKDTLRATTCLWERWVRSVWKIPIFRWLYCTMNGEKSQEKALENEDLQGLNREARRRADGTNKAGPKQTSRGTGRTRVFAILVYEDSAPSDWRDRLTQEHVSAFISPYHDQDTNPDGTQKKPHWHVLVMYDSVKSQNQVDEMWDRVLGPDRVKHYETVNSTRGYARYLCHLDNPEKAQYDRADVVSLGGADYDEVVSLPSDDWDMLDQIFDYIEEHHVRYYSRFMKYCRKERRDWWKLLVQRHSYVVIAYLKAEATARREEREAVDQELRDFGRIVGHVDEETGEFIPGFEDLNTEDKENDC